MIPKKSPVFVTVEVYYGIYTEIGTTPIQGKGFGNVTRSLNSVSIDGRSEKCPDKQNSTFDPEMLKMRQNLDISLFQGTVSATKDKKYI